MKLNQTHTIRALLLIYLVISAAVCIALPRHLADEKNDSGRASSSSAPLKLPPDIQQRIDAHADSRDNTPQEKASPEPEATPQASGAADAEPEPQTPPETSGEADAEPQETPETTEPKTPPENTGYVSTKQAGARVNLRAAADSGSEIIGSVCEGDAVTVLSASGKWYEIQTGDITGYIHQNYLVFADE